MVLLSPLMVTESRGMWVLNGSSKSRTWIMLASLCTISVSSPLPPLLIPKARKSHTSGNSTSQILVPLTPGPAWATSTRPSSWNPTTATASAWCRGPTAAART
eukprot:Lithocolla_globosa_v1_NODE_313_length_4540_cov_17.716005.p5 type:complete len:103 gc:universal NODE_313_length_4540_cov_17.716005:1630-1322(-)